MQYREYVLNPQTLNNNNSTHKICHWNHLLLQPMLHPNYPYRSPNRTHPRPNMKQALKHPQQVNMRHCYRQQNITIEVYCNTITPYTHYYVTALICIGPRWSIPTTQPEEFHLQTADREQQRNRTPPRRLSLIANDFLSHVEQSEEEEQRKSHSPPALPYDFNPTVKFLERMTRVQYEKQEREAAEERRRRCLDWTPRKTIPSPFKLRTDMVCKYLVLLSVYYYIVLYCLYISCLVVCLL